MSLFHALPYLVIEKIFIYTVDTSHIDINSLKPSLDPLLWLCQSWRSVGLQYKLKCYKIEVHYDKIVKSMCTWPKDLDLSAASIGPWVKKLYVVVEFPMSNSVLEWVNKNKPLFTFANSLEIRIIRQPKKHQSQKASVANIAIFVQYLQCLAPNIRDLKVTNYGRTVSKPGNVYRAHYEALIRLLFSRFAKRKLELGYKGTLDLGVKGVADHINEITHLKLTGRGFLGVAAFVRRCSMSLQVFNIRGYDTGKILYKMLAKNTTGRYVIYPQMRYLKVEFKPKGVYKIPYPTFPGAVPFPNLQKLELSRGYLLGDGVLFRGSQHTLRSIKVDLTPNLAILLRYNHTFSGAIPYRCLEKVEVSTIQNDFIDYDYYYNLPLIADIGKHANRLCFRSRRYFNDPAAMAAILRLNPQSTLQILHIESIGLTLANFIKLVGQFPRLKDLRCAVRKM